MNSGRGRDFHNELSSVLKSNSANPLAGSMQPSGEGPVASMPGAGASAPSSAHDAVTHSLMLIEAVAQTKDQNDAIVALTKQAAEILPHFSIRCGIGSTRLRRFYDSRLGWLGPASELFQSAAARWNDDETLSLSSVNPIAKTRDPIDAREGGARFNLDDDAGLGRCVLWIEGGTVSEQNRWWIRRCLPVLRTILWQRTGGIASHLFRTLATSGLTTRIYLGLASLILLLLAIWPVPYRVRCTSVIRPLQSRVVSAPFAATLEAAHVRPGDTVRIGDPLITLDGRPLRLELESIDAQIAQVEKEQDIALVSGRIADSQQAKLKIRELSRDRQLLAERLERLSVNSPIDGVVVAGDLDRSIGSPLETGQLVLEVAPLDKMVVEIEIPESDIGYVQNGTIARVRLTAGNHDKIEQPIENVYPAAELRDDQNVFVGRVPVDNSNGQLRPGMRGEAIAYGPLRPWLWSMVRSGTEKAIWWVGY